MKITISEFAEIRGIKQDTVNAYMRRHNLVDDSQKDKWQYEIDTNTEVYQILEKQYPLPQPIEIVEDKESQKKLIEVQDELAKSLKNNVELQEQLTTAMAQVTKLATVQRLLESKNADFERVSAELKEAVENNYKKDLKIVDVSYNNKILKMELEKIKADTEKEISELKEQLENEKNKSWFQKLFKK